PPPHPHSNQCYQRKVLQGFGGKLRHVRGILGYSSGSLQVHVANRLPDNLSLEELPSRKAEACQWIDLES
ncbi:MAG: hypothetical protein OXT67_08285, partial [Zetaproteobacteria bacterium]|nr:hypothetical protein [Zetaproteobacteria bacterium]